MALLLSSGVGAAPDEARRFWRARGGPWAPCGSSCGLRVAGGGEMWLPIQRAALPKPPSRGWDAGRRVAGVPRRPSEGLPPRGTRRDGFFCSLVCYIPLALLLALLFAVLCSAYRRACGCKCWQYHLRIRAPDTFGFCSEPARENQLNLAAAASELHSSRIVRKLGGWLLQSAERHSRSEKRCPKTAPSARRSA